MNYDDTDIQNLGQAHQYHTLHSATLGADRVTEPEGMGETGTDEDLRTAPAGRHSLEGLKQRGFNTSLRRDSHLSKFRTLVPME